MDQTYGQMLFTVLRDITVAPFLNESRPNSQGSERIQKDLLNETNRVLQSPLT